MGLLGFEGLAHAQRIILRPAPIERLALAPLARLGIQVGHIGELAPGEEGSANKFDLALDPTLLIATCDGHRTRLEAVVRGEGQEFGIEANRISLAFKHDAFKVVIEQGSRQPSERGERLDMPPQEAVHLALRQKRRKMRRE